MVHEKTVDILPNFVGYKEACLCFKTGAPKELGSLRPSFEDFSALGPSALRQFHERLVLGESFPSKMILSEGTSLDHAMALLLFQHPDLVLSSRMAYLVNAVDLYVRLGVSGLAMLPPQDRDLIARASEPLRQVQDPPKAQFEGLRQAALILAQDIQFNTIPEPCTLTPISEHRNVVRYNSNLPQLAEVYAQGFMGGMWQGPQHTLLFKKSVFCSDIDLDILFKKVQDTGSPQPEGWILLDDGCSLLCHVPLSEDAATLVWDMYLDLL